MVEKKSGKRFLSRTNLELKMLIVLLCLLHLVFAGYFVDTSFNVLDPNIHLTSGVAAFHNRIILQVMIKEAPIFSQFCNAIWTIRMTCFRRAGQHVLYDVHCCNNWVIKLNSEKKLQYVIGTSSKYRTCIVHGRRRREPRGLGRFVYCNLLMMIVTLGLAWFDVY